MTVFTFTIILKKFFFKSIKIATDENKKNKCEISSKPILSKDNNQNRRKWESCKTDMEYQRKSSPEVSYHFILIIIYQKGRDKRNNL